MVQNGRMILLTIAGWALLIPGHAMAAAHVSVHQEAVIGRCIKASARGSLWLEQTLWGLRDQEGGQIGTISKNRDRSEDLGPMQINSWWLTPIATALQRDRSEVRAWLINDPCFNVEAARWIFVDGLRASKNYWVAVGLYHSPTIHRQRGYAASVAQKLARRYGAKIFSQE